MSCVLTYSDNIGTEVYLFLDEDRWSFGGVVVNSGDESIGPS